MTDSKKETGRRQHSNKLKGSLILGSASLMLFLGMWEGDAQYTVYADKLAQGIPTVCKGITRHVTNTPIIVGEVWSKEKCELEERVAVEKVQLRLMECFAILPPQSVFDMATSHAWNNGVANTCGSAAMRSWQKGDWALGCRRMAVSDLGKPVWSYVRTGRKLPNGKPEFKFVQGLANRRQAEAARCYPGEPA